MYDAAIIGAGFGGLGAALRLAERGARVVVHETLAYPGGCASTFTRHGRTHEAGATLFSGFGEGQLFSRWVRAHDMDVDFVAIDPPITLRTRELELPVYRDKARFVASVLATEARRAPQLSAFFEEQQRVADALWALFDDPALLPPLSLSSMSAHALRLPRYLPVVRWMGRSLHDVMAHFDVADVAALRLFADATSQITVQASARDAEAPFALATLDYPFRGTGHVRGGIGRLARAMVSAIGALGGEVRLADRVKSVRPDAEGFRIEARRGAVSARRVVMNLLPRDAAALAGIALPASLDATARAVDEGWGACMLYATLDPRAGLRQEAHHMELVDEPHAAFEEGNHAFVSIAALDERHGPDGARTATASTHVSLRSLRELPPQDRAQRIAAISSRMRETIDRLAPELSSAITYVMPGSPRTFARFTGRSEGAVGGAPRRVGLAQYARLLRTPALAPGIHLVGDSYLLGQSTLATALSGIKVADAIFSADR